MENKALLIILDGYGEGKDYQGNAITRSEASYIEKLRSEYPDTLLKTDGESVGLPAGTMGGSEVGHFTMGCGRIVFQSLEMINRSIREGDFFEKEAFIEAMNTKGKVHLLGMISDAGIHSHLSHLFALMKMAKEQGVQSDNLFIHAITDGRDVPEKSAAKYIKQIEEKIAELGIGRIATIVGRYYTMDRDQNWDRSEAAYKLYTQGEGISEAAPLTAIENAYARGDDTDYYIKPIILDKSGLISAEDSIINFNFRSDRAAQITSAFTDAEFDGFETPVKTHYVCFGPYSKIAPVVFPPTSVSNNLGQVISETGEPQLRLAETEKFPHVTFFFNSQIKEPYPGEKRVSVDSPKVASYAEKPEMSAQELTTAALKEMQDQEYKLVVLNYANPDLVGHSGELEPTKESIEVVNDCIKQVVELAQSQGYDIIVTADHGNAEYMVYEDTGEPCPSHTHNKVICILVSEKYKNANLRQDDDAGLYDIAPTILDILNLTKPPEMTGKTLIQKS